ncbi:ribosomal protein S18 acetylase RimI-like enzyme [Phyllobacterium ifriqiyense]|uniref:Ribosomal protein S18 acetylase RimI-like enzyme n=1 Tax=Phyllobacterium ifriqiyense TaxID=314238 RepID=A0ABU0SAF8_9HYPH|nr:GNAT family N-acetyltransferase [Phyllobacterium ifriqiyense]MDQ0997732.1 ribosomal protein S18 acetylase RimI-like enzyme [Phyllobacterium ifriqiyense]
MKIVIREALHSDAQNLAALSIQVWLHTYAKAGIRDVFSRYVFAEFTAERFAGEIESRIKQLYVAEVENHLVGYVRLNLEAECPIRHIGQPEIETLYVQEHFAGCGIGSALLNHAVEACQSHDHRQAWLTVNQQNLPAYRFYQRKLFQKIGTVDFVLESERHANDVLVKVF